MLSIWLSTETKSQGGMRDEQFEAGGRSK